MNRTLADFQAAQQQQAAINAIFLRGGRTMSSSSVITPEDVLESLMNDGTIDALRLKIINQLKANEELKNTTIKMAEESKVFYTPGAEKQTKRELFDALRQELELAFVNLVLALCGPGDSVVMFQPYYFNAYMAFQMTGVTNIIVGPGHPDTLYPGADWLEKTLSESKPTPKVVTVVNPCNPSGTYVPEPLLKRISKICEDAGCWLIVDNTYEYFMYDGLKHCCVEGDNIVNVFSFSKTYGMMGWRLGYVSNGLLTEIRWVRGRAFENSRQHPNLCFHNISAPASLASSALTANPPFKSDYFFPLSSLSVYEYE
ncbi:hypothetical protein HID58_051642 [Brassica napus]|uniref:Aminotransferase class I/classII large domain-containing protein n=1 Tax=Brassica napus TaxID=3708 RepID=A0ABQ8A9Z2_BRANA|nr:hypothetical protein HID58_051642 [Brassica napus]